MTRTKTAHLLRVLANYVIHFGVIDGSLRCVYDVVRWALLPHRQLLTVQTPSGRKVQIRARSSDFLVFDEVILQQCYSLKKFPQFKTLQDRYANLIATGKTPLIIDAGTNIGLACLAFREEFPAAEIIGLEPESDNIALARKNTASLGGIILLHQCLWYRPSALIVEDRKAADFSFSFQENESHSAASIQGATIDELLQKYPGYELFLLKIDIEGAETEIFAASGEWWQTRPILMIEPHDWLGIGRQSLRGVLQKAMYQDGDVIVKDNIIMFLPASVS